jgi:hypothetical protein
VHFSTGFQNAQMLKTIWNILSADFADYTDLISAKSADRFFAK